MRELLERWAKVEPERCEGTHVKIGGVWRMTEYNQGNVLAAVIEAIEARGWGWTINTNTYRPATTEGPPATREYNGFVFPRAGPENMAEDYRLDSPAAALLSAYLITLEAQQ